MGGGFGGASGGMGGFGGLGGRGRPGGMSHAEWVYLAEKVFSKIHEAASQGQGQSVKEEMYTRPDGRRVVRRTVTTRQPGGGFSTAISERVVGEGGPYDYYRTAG